MPIIASSPFHFVRSSKKISEYEKAIGQAEKLLKTSENREEKNQFETILAGLIRAKEKSQKWLNLISSYIPESYWHDHPQVRKDLPLEEARKQARREVRR